LQITPERLRQVEEGEEYLRGLGIQGDLRVRHHGQSARLEVAPGQMDILQRQWDRVALVFAELGFTSVELDPLGYRRGGLLSLARPAAH
jgi:pyridinium-3,5-biscarboxylic acid mononucleotide sulfurtransferase